MTTEDLTVVVIGGDGAKNISLINAIKKIPEPIQEPSETPVPIKEPSETQILIEEKRKNINFVATPGLCKADQKNELIKEIKTCISKSGRHLFLFVVPLETFTDEKKKMTEMVKNTFGEKVTDHIILVFTDGNISGKNSLEKFIGNRTYLEALYRKCKQRYVIFNTEDENPSQVNELLDQIKVLNSEKNPCYTYNMLKKAESRAGLRTRVRLSINGGALVGAGVGATASHFAQGMLGVGAGAAVGAAAGGVVGAVGIVVAQHILEKCLLC